MKYVATIRWFRQTACNTFESYSKAQAYVLDHMMTQGDCIHSAEIIEEHSGKRVFNFAQSYTRTEWPSMFED